MTNQTHTTFPTKKAAADHQKRVSAMAADNGEEEKHILANRYKTKMCKNFVAKGECPYEVRCMFAHGEQELRTSEENIRDGLVTEEAIKAFQRQQNQAKRRATYAAAREAEARAAAQQQQQQQEMYLESEDNSEEAYYHQHPSVNAPRFIPQAQAMQHAAGYFTHNPYAYNILPAEAREFAVYAPAAAVEESGFWYETPVEEDYYFPSSDMMAPLVPSSAAPQQQQQHYHHHAAAAGRKMYDSVNTGSFSDEAATYGQSETSEYAAYAPKAQCTAAEMPSFTEEAPIVLEP